MRIGSYEFAKRLFLALGITLQIWKILQRLERTNLLGLKVRFGLEHAMQNNVPQLTSAPLRVFGLGEKIGSGGYVGLPSF